MLHKNDENRVNQVQMVSIDSLVPKNHLLRKIDETIDFSFIYDLIEDKYCLDNGRPSIDPIVLFKIHFWNKKYASNNKRNRGKCSI